MVRNVNNINGINLDIISLFRSNYLSQFYVRQMAKLIGKSHVGLLPHLKELERGGVLISKEIGKSKIYSLNLDNNQVREFLSFAEKKKTLELLDNEVFINKVYDEIISLDLSGSLILFGSYASGTQTKKSDIDLLYLGGLEEKEAKVIKNLGKTYNKEIHLVFMSLKQFKEQLLKRGALAKEVTNNHIILYNHDIFINEIWRHYYERKER